MLLPDLVLEADPDARALTFEDETWTFGRLASETFAGCRLP